MPRPRALHEADDILLLCQITSSRRFSAALLRQHVIAEMGQMKWGALEVRMGICMGCCVCMRIDHAQAKS